MGAGEMDHGEGPVRELGRFWDVLIQEGTPATSDPELGAELAELVVWLHEARPGPAPNAVR